MATFPTGNHELLVVTDKVGRHPGELGVYKSMGWDIFPFSALTQSWFGRQEEHPACKETGCWFVGGGDLTGGWSFDDTICVESTVKHQQSNPICQTLNTVIHIFFTYLLL